jgi:ParB family chromosome partitioning protein
MNVIQIKLYNLKVSDRNVRTTLTSDEDETTINDLASNIKKNGLINPLTVRNTGGDYFEIIAGQRRFLACKKNNMESISCSIINVPDQKAEEISLVENVQRNQMTNIDKIRSYSNLYKVYNNDLDKVAATIHISIPTLQRYLKLNILPNSILEKLDSKNEKITLDVAVSLTKLPSTIEHNEILSTVDILNSKQQVKAIQQFSLLKSDNINYLKDICQDIIFYKQNNILPSVPFVFDK